MSSEQIVGHKLHALAPRSSRRTLLIASALIAAAIGSLSPGSARAQCSIGEYLGSCPGAVSYAGCCPTEKTTQWCEGTALCGIDCSGNTGSGACCTASEFAGCSDASVESCVCNIDDYCCDTWFGAWDAFCVDLATTDCGACAGTGAGPVYCGWQAEQGFYDCLVAPSADPSGANPMTCGPACTPACDGRQCGPDGCGGICGQCLSSESCVQGGVCQPTCAAQCGGKACGPNGCGGVCGQCLSTQTCSAAGTCEDPTCAPSCGGRECGPDGCGGTCGACAAAATCVAGQCEGPACVPSCGSRICGDDGCGGSCGTCTEGSDCQAGACVSSCVPSCGTATCGDDGCGGSCGTCSGNEACVDGECASSCSCVGRQCGDDGCGRICGYCVAGSTCNATFECQAQGTGGDSYESTIAEPLGCPAGQIWSAYAAACVIDRLGGSTPSARSSDGCSGGAAPGPREVPRGATSFLVALVLGAIGYRLARRRVDASPGDGGPQAHSTLKS